MINKPEAIFFDSQWQTIGSNFNSDLQFSSGFHPTFPSCASVPSKKEFFRCSNFPFKMQSIPTLGVSNPIFTVCSWASTREKELSFYFLSIASAAITRLVISWCEMHNSRRKREGDLREREMSQPTEKRGEKRYTKITLTFLNYPTYWKLPFTRIIH